MQGMPPLLSTPVYFGIVELHFAQGVTLVDAAMLAEAALLSILRLRLIDASLMARRCPLVKGMVLLQSGCNARYAIIALYTGLFWHC
jgi:hypothetical protein